MPGEIAFGRYVLLDKIAVGGMAEVFLAHATGEAGFRKACVIKRVLPHLALRPGFREMFLEEAKVAARLNHPGVVQIFDLGREGEDFYIAMEYLAGEDVGAILRRAHQLKRPVPVEVAARIVASVAEALHHAHELGIVHRDISPSNIVVTYQGTVKLLDFGIARAEQRLGDTKGGAVKGKLAYMAPEQALSRPGDRRMDVWALGVTLHELLTQERLFVRDSLQATYGALVKDRIPRPRERRSSVPEELDELTMRAVERDPEKRLPTADALRAGLERFLADRTYVPSQLGEFVRDLFGEERVKQRMQLGAQNGAQTARPEPTPMLSSVIGVSSDPTVIASPEFYSARKRAPRRTWPWVALGAAGFVTGAGVLGRAYLQPAPVPAPPPPVAPPLVALARPPPPEPPVQPPAEPAPAEPEPTPPHAVAEGWLAVESNVAGQVQVDGAKAVGLPLNKLRLPAGEHRVRLTNAALGIAKTVHVRVRPGTTTESRVDVVMGTLNVTVEPWADVFLDGFHLGQTPLAGRAVAAGAHELKLVNPNGEKKLKVNVPSASTLVVREALP